jgi:hypothetical protein
LQAEPGLGCPGLVRRLFQIRSASEGPMCKPTFFLRPSVPTATAIMVATLTIDPT